MTVRDRLDETLARIEGARSGAHVFMKLYPESARAAADAADARARAGVSLGPLDGALVSIKDLFDVAGETTTAGSVILRDAPPAAADAPAIARLRRAGAVILGKTNMVEFAFAGIGLNPHYGTPGSAADPSRIPGGSTSGGAVSVGEGTSEITIGSDTGGSTRIPAAFNGVVGFKPTARRVPLEGAFPLSYALDSVGPLARTVQACADADAVMAGEEPRALDPRPLAGLRVGVPRGRLFADTDAAVSAAFEACLSRLEAAGARIADHAIEDLLAALADVTAPASIAAIEASEVHKDWLDGRAGEFDPRVRSRIARAASIEAHTYIRMMRKRAALIREMDARLSPVDVLALPTVPVVPPPIAPLVADDDLYYRTNLLVLRNTMIANFFDLTAISLPVPGQALPVGFMLIARNGRDRHLLAVAAAAEAELGRALS
ncbi:MAG TPA: amidase [Beijerinckiaceae bacterium]|jgi:aspartyl-tRNA(Asn)/glutamyl-tRNA(Gln) amidotransferase subunit A